MTHFTPTEFQCPCCGKAVMDGVFLAMLDHARRLAGIPFKINSGYRCQEHNDSLKGSSKSSAHLHGKAADIAVGNSQERFKILNAIMHAGFTRFGDYPTFIHVDSDKNKPQQVAWRR